MCQLEGATRPAAAAANASTSAGKGVVVFSACSHAGIINVMKDVATLPASHRMQCLEVSGSIGVITVKPMISFLW